MRSPWRRRCWLARCAAGLCLSCPSVPIQKFLRSLGVDVEGTAAEALDGGKDVVGCLDPTEGFGIGVAGVDEGLDRRHQLADRSVGAALDLLLRQVREEPLDLVDPGG